jgi:hypothetical protein
VPGDRMRVRADGPGRVVFERIDERAEVEATVSAKPARLRGAVSSAR